MEGELERELEMGAGVGAVVFIQRAGANASKFVVSMGREQVSIGKTKNSV